MRKFKLWEILKEIIGKIMGKVDTKGNYRKNNGKSLRKIEFTYKLSFRTKRVLIKRYLRCYY